MLTLVTGILNPPVHRVTREAGPERLAKLLLGVL